MSDISKDARAIIDGAKGMDDPSPSDKERVFNMLEATLGQLGGEGGVPGSPSSSNGRSFASSRKRIIWFALAGFCIVGTLAGTYFWRGNHPEAQINPVPSLNLESPRAPGALDETKNAGGLEVAVAPTEAPPPRGAAEGAWVERTAPSNRKKSGVGSSDPSGGPKMSNGADSAAGGDASNSGSSLKEELRLLNAAQVARGVGDTGEALVLLKEHETRFKRGLLVEEREAARVLTFCDRKQFDRAREVTRRFLDRFPNSPLVSTVRSSCVFEKETGVMISN